MKFREKMMGFMMDRTGPEEKQAMMAQMMERFFADMTAEDKQHMMETMMPRMMEGMNMIDMMPKMMMGMTGEGKEACCMPEMTEGSQGKGMSGMPQMMMQTMPHCLQMMLPHVAKDQRKEFVLHMVDTLMEQCCTDMSEGERQEFVAQVMEKCIRRRPSKHRNTIKYVEMARLGRRFNWRYALAVAQTETLTLWHRQGFRFFWCWKSRPGQPANVSRSSSKPSKTAGCWKILPNSSCLAF